MKRQLWELSLEELEEEILITNRTLETGGYSKLVADHLLALQEQRQIREIKEYYRKQS